MPKETKDTKKVGSAPDGDAAVNDTPATTTEDGEGADAQASNGEAGEPAAAPAPAASPATPDTSASATPSPALAAAPADPREEFKRMRKDFGAIIAADIFESDGTYEDAKAKHLEAVEAENEALKTETENLKAQIKSGASPAAFQADDGDAQPSKYDGKLSDGAAKFAESINLPK